MRVKELLFAKRNDAVDHSMMLNEVSQMVKSRKCGERVGTTKSVVCVPKDVDLATSERLEGDMPFLRRQH